MVEISCRNGPVFQIDAEDAEWARSFVWRALPENSRAKLYVYRHDKGDDGKKRIVYIHRLLLDAPADLLVDHINRNPLDNRRANLRLVTKRQNNFNAGPRAEGFKGVSCDPRDRKPRWRASIRCDSKRVYLGGFATPEEAARAYDKKARELFGEFAYCNFPD